VLDVTVRYSWGTLTKESVTYRIESAAPVGEWTTQRLLVPIDDTHGWPTPYVDLVQLRAIDPTSGSGSIDYNASVRNVRIKGVWPKVAVTAAGVRVHSSPDYYTEIGPDGAASTGDFEVGGRVYLGGTGAAFEMTADG